MVRIWYLYLLLFLEYTYRSNIIGIFITLFGIMGSTVAGPEDVTMSGVLSYFFFCGSQRAQDSSKIDVWGPNDHHCPMYFYVYWSWQRAKQVWSAGWIWPMDHHLRRPALHVCVNTHHVSSMPNKALIQDWNHGVMMCWDDQSQVKCWNGEMFLNCFEYWVCMCVQPIHWDHFVKTPWNILQF